MGERKENPQIRKGKKRFEQKLLQEKIVKRRSEVLKQKWQDYEMMQMQMQMQKRRKAELAD